MTIYNTTVDTGQMMSSTGTSTIPTGRMRLMVQRDDAVELRVVAGHEIDAVGSHTDRDRVELHKPADWVLGEVGDKAVDGGGVAAVDDLTEVHSERPTSGE